MSNWATISHSQTEKSTQAPHDQLTVTLCVMLQDKKFRRACAEGKEVFDRRAGKATETTFRPHDFLHPGWSDDSDEEAAEDRSDDLRPLPASAEKLQDCSADQALLWLLSVACNPLERPKVGVCLCVCA